MSKIVLEYTGRLASTPITENDIRGLFAAIAHRIRINDITINPTPGLQSERIIITYAPQPSSPNCDLRKEIEGVVERRVHLRIIEVTLPQKKIMVSGLKNINADPDCPAYEVSPDLVYYLASNLHKCREILDQNVIDIKLEFAEESPNKYIYNGVIAFVTGPQTANMFLKHYKLLAQFILNNEAPRVKILSPSFFGFELSFNKEGVPRFNIKSIQASPAPVAANTSSPK